MSNLNLQITYEPFFRVRMMQDLSSKSVEALRVDSRTYRRCFRRVSIHTYHVVKQLGYQVILVFAQSR
jgi:hypothetical protein